MLLGTKLVRVTNSFAVFKKLKVLSTSQQAGTLYDQHQYGQLTPSDFD